MTARWPRSPIENSNVSLQPSLCSRQKSTRCVVLLASVEGPPRVPEGPAGRTVDRELRVGPRWAEALGRDYSTTIAMVPVATGVAEFFGVTVTVSSVRPGCDAVSSTLWGVQSVQLSRPMAIISGSPTTQSNV